MTLDLDELIGFKDHNPNPITKETVDFVKDVLLQLSEFNKYFNGCYPHGDGGISLEYQLNMVEFLDIIVQSNKTFDIVHTVEELTDWRILDEKYNTTLEEIIKCVKQNIQ